MDFKAWIKVLLATAIGGAAAAASQTISTGQPINQAKGAAVAGAIVAVAGLFAPQPHK